MEQPVGVSKSLQYYASFTPIALLQTGFSQGTPNITDDDELAMQLTGFLGQFLEVFNELKGNNFYLTGESVRPPISVSQDTAGG